MVKKDIYQNATVFFETFIKHPFTSLKQGMCVCEGINFPMKPNAVDYAFGIIFEIISSEMVGNKISN